MPSDPRQCVFRRHLVSPLIMSSGINSLRLSQFKRLLVAIPLYLTRLAIKRISAVKHDVADRRLTNPVNLKPLLFTISSVKKLGIFGHGHVQAWERSSLLIFQVFLATMIFSPFFDLVEHIFLIFSKTFLRTSAIIRR